MANDPRSTIKNPDPARPDDSLIPQPGDTYPGVPDPAFASADNPAQQKADQVETSESGGRRQMASEQKSTRRQRTGKKKESGQQPSDQQQMADYRRGKRRQQSGEDSSNLAQSPGGLGDPSPGDENPRIIQPGKPQRS